MMFKKHRCTKCSFIYNSEIGYPDDNIAPGTLFEELPEYWVCPLCGAAKKFFKEVDTNMNKYRCTACGYIYDPMNGDPDAGINAGTSFGDLPDDWECPLCGVGKDFFEEVTE